MIQCTTKVYSEFNLRTKTSGNILDEMSVFWNRRRMPLSVAAKLSILDVCGGPRCGFVRDQSSTINGGNVP